MEFGVWRYINAFYLLSLSLKMQKFCSLERGRCKNSAWLYFPLIIYISKIVLNLIG